MTALLFPAIRGHLSGSLPRAHGELQAIRNLWNVVLGAAIAVGATACFAYGVPYAEKF
jgi:hypothetical protein